MHATNQPTKIIKEVQEKEKVEKRPRGQCGTRVTHVEYGLMLIYPSHGFIPTVQVNTKNVAMYRPLNAVSQ